MPGTGRINVRTGIIALMAALFVFFVGAVIYWVHPSVGRTLLTASLGMLVVLLLVLAITVLLKDRFTLTLALLGFCTGVLLGALAFYGSRLGAELKINQHLALVLCPPSLASMTLDNAGLAEDLAGWFFIAVANAGLYAIVAASLHWLWRKALRPSR